VFTFSNNRLTKRHCLVLLSGLSGITFSLLLPTLGYAQTFRVVSGGGNNTISTAFATAYTPSNGGGPSPTSLWQTSGANKPTYFVTTPFVTGNAALREYITTDLDGHGSATSAYNLPVDALTITTLWNPTPTTPGLDNAQDVSVLIPGATPGTYRGDEWDKFFRYDVTFTVPLTIGSQFSILGEVRSDNSMYDVIYDYGTAGETVLALGATNTPLPLGATALPNPYLRNNTDVPTIASFVSSGITITPGSTHTISFITFNSHDPSCDTIQPGQVCPSPATMLFDFNINAIIPEPATLALLGVGGLGGFLLRRRNKSSLA
jgi:hypothetical protein